MLMREMGGYLPLELNTTDEYYSNDNYDVLRLNCGRTAIITAIKDGMFSKVYLPLYLCESVGQALEKGKIPYSLYNISEDFSPFDVSVKKNEAIVIVNYFGVIPETRIRQLIKTYKNVILDNTQAFFIRPISEVYNVYSCRKFLGVCDGAYLVKKHLKRINYPMDFSGKRSLFLLSSLESGTNSNYKDSLANEEYLCSAPMMQMSILTQKILTSINYDKIKNIRKDNFNYLHERLASYNEINDTIFFQTYSPMVYPFMFSDRDIREALVKQFNIYIPQFWKWVIQSPQSNNFERSISKNIYALPIDQRYTREEMDYLADTIISLINE